MAKNILKGMELITSTNKNLLSPPTLGDRMNFVNESNPANGSAGSNKKFNFLQINKVADDAEQKSSAIDSASASIQIHQPNAPERVLKIKKKIQNKSYIDTRVIQFVQKQLQREKIVEKLENEKNSKGQGKEEEEADKQKNDNISQALSVNNDKR